MDAFAGRFKCRLATPPSIHYIFAVRCPKTRSESGSSLQNAWIRRDAWLLAWLLLAAVAAWGWPATAIDETRSLSVAWEMHAQGAWLLPRLNGGWQAQEPPLLFWIIGAAWNLFGVSAGCARLVIVAMGLATMGIVGLLARRLWPQAEGVGRLAALLTGGTLLWALWSAAILFDMLLAACVAGGALALHAASCGGRAGRPGWVGFATAMGLGLLGKGPVILLHLLPLALAAPWWSAAVRERPARWFAGVAIALIVGIAVALAWALPAAAVAGERFGVEIIRDQMTGRAIHGLSHLRPWWWYLPILPLLLLPWAAWPDWWRQLRSALRSDEPGVRFSLAWLASFLPFCVVSAKQPHYLLPLIPAIAMLVARSVSMGSAMSYSGGRRLAMLPLALLGAVLAVGLLGPEDWHGGWLRDVHPAWGAAILVAVGWAAFPDRMTMSSAVLRIHVATVVAVALLVTALQGSQSGRSFDTSGAGREIASLQAGGVVTACWGEYRGQLGFAGRLTGPMPEARDIEDLRALVVRAPGARVLVESRRNPLLAAGVPPEAAFAYRRKYWSIWPAQQLVADPGILRLIRAIPRLRD